MVGQRFLRLAFQERDLVALVELRFRPTAFPRRGLPVRYCSTVEGADRPWLGVAVQGLFEEFDEGAEGFDCVRGLFELLELQLDKEKARCCAVIF